MGGGVGILYRDNLNIERASVNAYQSFEYAEWKVNSGTYNINIAAIYRPPYSDKNRFTQSNFLKEFPSILDKLSSYKDPIYLLGDLNFHLDIPDDTYSKQLTSLLESYDMKQLVNFPTHTSGHTLDVVIHRNSDNIVISDLEGDYFISDHCFTSFKISKPKPPLETKIITFRKWNSVNDTEFMQDLHHNLIPSHGISDTDHIVSNFNAAIKSTIDKHLPLKHKKITVRPEIPWYSKYLRTLKQYRRTIEKIHLRFNTSLSKFIYNKIKNRYTTAVKTAISDYYRNVVQDTNGNTKKLYNIISKLTGRQKENPLPPSTNDSELANSFLDYFSSKIVKIRSELDNMTTSRIADSSPVPSSVSPVSEVSNDSCFSSFNALSEAEVKNIILKSKSTTCELDLIPTTKLKA